MDLGHVSEHCTTGKCKLRERVYIQNALFGHAVNNWENRYLRSSIDGLSREEASEVSMGSLCSNFQLALQVGDPALHEMYIVQEHPAALLGVLVQNGLCWPFLSLHTNSQDLL